MEPLNIKFKFLTPLVLLLTVSFGFYLGLSDDRTAAVNPYNSSVSITEYTGDMIGAWSYGANVLLPSRFSGVGIGYMRNDTGWLYVMGGDVSGSGTNTNRNERYNLKTDSWSVMSPMLSSLQYFGAARLKDSLYSIAGMVTSFFTSAISNLRKYDINANTWVERSPLPQVLGWPECVGYQDSIIYSAGGCINGSSTAGAQVYVYNVLINSWRPGTPLPIPREGGALGIKGDTLIYVGGASDYFPPIMSTVYVGLISQSNRANISWTVGASKPGLTKWRFDAHDWGCKGIIVDMGASTGFGTSTEVYVYSPGLNTWTQMPNSLTPTSTSQSGSFAFSGNIYKLVCASGLVMSPPYSIPQTQIFTDTLCPDTVGVIEPGVEIPDHYSLGQNYPNPFNPVTTITYALPKANAVRLVVFDILGREVAVLVNEFKQAGIYDVLFDASNLASGIYFYRIETEDPSESSRLADGKAGQGFAQTKKMLLVR